MQVTFLGTLYITDKHTCFSDPSDQISFCLAHKDVREVKKILSKSRKPGESCLWRVHRTLSLLCMVLPEE